jgi:hypothetical protein
MIRTVQDSQTVEIMHRFSPNPNLAHLIHWHEWENDAFQMAREQNKPVMLFLAAFWCRYCQRMDEQAFSDRENLALLNAYFIALRVEDAKRPDIDARYNLNGWPTIAFFTPAGELISAANYLPSDEFKELLLNVYLDYQQRSGASSSAEVSDESESRVAQPGRHEPSYASRLSGITDAIMALADRQHGGYGHGQKFIHADANDFLLSRYEATKDRVYLDQICLTLDRMRDGSIHDFIGGGFFRTSSGADWSQPHREKLLAEQTGLLSNCLRTFRVTRREEYARTAEEIIGYLDRKLLDASIGAFFGCEDFLRRETGEPAEGEFYSITDECIYTDANAKAVCAYFEAAAVLGRADCKERALNVLEFLWHRCHDGDGGMSHYHDGTPRLPGLLVDQAEMGKALVQAHRLTGDIRHLERAREVAEFILARLRNPSGGYFDRCSRERYFLKLQLIQIEGNGSAALFLLKLAQATNELKYREAARWALDAFPDGCASFGVHAASFGQALDKFLDPN